MRVVSLIAGITLLVTGIAGARSGAATEVGDERDRRLETTAELTAAQLDATIARISAVLAVATPDTDVEPARRRPRRSRCAPSTPAGATCSTRHPTVADDAASRTPSTRRRAPAGPSCVVAAVATGHRRPTSSSPSTRGRAGCYASATLDTSDLPDGHERRARAGRRRAAAAGPHGRRRRGSYAAPSMVEFEDGPWAVRTTTAGDRPADDRGALADRRPARASAPCSPSLALGGMIADHRVAAAAGDDRRADPAARTAPSSSGGRPRCSPGSGATAARPA